MLGLETLLVLNNRPVRLSGQLYHPDCALDVDPRLRNAAPIDVRDARHFKDTPCAYCDRPLYEFPHTILSSEKAKVHQ